jgi:hypothetical protein
LTKEKREICPPARSEERLPPGWKHFFERPKQRHEKQEAQTRSEKCERKAHLPLAWGCGVKTALDLEPGKNNSGFLPVELELVVLDDVERIAGLFVDNFAAAELVLSTNPRFVRTRDLELEATVPDCLSWE